MRRARTLAPARAPASPELAPPRTHPRSGRKLGGGNYGAVYEGFKGDEAEPSVVIKETSSKAELVDGCGQGEGDDEGGLVRDHG